jgi:hypothetical protein
MRTFTPAQQEIRNQRAKAWYLDKKGRAAITSAEWLDTLPLRVAWNRQRNHAKARGIDFHFSFNEWVSWWGSDIENTTKGEQHAESGRL